MARISLDQLRASRPQVDRAKMDATTEADIRRHTVEDGQNPDAAPDGYRLIPAPAEIRGNLGLTQQGFAQVLGVPVATYRNWEQGRKVPDPAAASLLRILYYEPEAALRALRLGPARTRTHVIEVGGFKRDAKADDARKAAKDAITGKYRGKPRRPTRKTPEAKDRA